MAVGFYVTVVRAAGRVGWLLGPYDSEQEARSHVPTARQLAEEIDPFTVFDLFGTARLEAPHLLPGVLNGRKETKCLN